MKLGRRWVGPAIGVLLVVNTGAWLGMHLDAARPVVCVAGTRLSTLALDSVGTETVGIRVIVEAGVVEGRPPALARVDIVETTDARVEVNGEPRGAPLNISFSPTVPSWSFDLRQTRRGASFAAQVAVTDACGQVTLTARSVDAVAEHGLEPTAAGPRLRATSAAFEQPGVALGLYRQSFPDDLTVLDGYERTAESRSSIVHWFSHWGGWKGQFVREDLERVARRGAVPMITWEPWAGINEPSWSLRDAILSGRQDAYIDAWARGLSEYGRPVLLRFAHEMHDQPDYPWVVGNHRNTADEYVSAWRRVRTIFARYDTRNVIWVWNPNVRGATSATELEPIYRSLYPGDDAVDWIGLSIYNTGPALDWGAPTWRPFDEIVQEPYRAITAVSGKPLVLGEVGTTEQGGNKADWINLALGPDLTRRFPRLKALVWFDVDKEQPWQIRSSTAAFDAFTEAWRRPTFDVDPAALFR